MFASVCLERKTLWLQQYKPNSLARLLCAVLADCRVSAKLLWVA